ncbi:MAG: YlmC/YmxH family sporulation protein [Firmicutes bacterium]|nr:YlmC/YmxH family sporulation protein [Alicyclobacillaceae bacterium]MCL6496824.1 YlmC/YmxH family sporulation protein [Bacillota bacterium]
MRFSELASKEVINLHTGARLGVVGDSDLVIDPATGAIHELLLPRRNRWGRSGPWIAVAWSAVRRVGPEVVIVDFGQPSSGENPGPGGY